MIVSQNQISYLTHKWAGRTLSSVVQTADRFAVVLRSIPISEPVVWWLLVGVFWFYFLFFYFCCAFFSFLFFVFVVGLKKKKYFFCFVGCLKCQTPM